LDGLVGGVLPPDSVKDQAHVPATYVSAIVLVLMNVLVESYQFTKRLTTMLVCVGSFASRSGMYGVLGKTWISAELVSVGLTPLLVDTRLM